MIKVCGGTPRTRRKKDEGGKVKSAKQATRGNGLMQDIIKCLKRTEDYLSVAEIHERTKTDSKRSSVSASLTYLKRRNQVVRKKHEGTFVYQVK
jgi:hypothetical protein